MSKYHAGKYGSPLCGTRGHGNRYHVITLAPKDWNALPEGQRCSKCAAKLQAEKVARDAAAIAKYEAAQAA